MVKENRNESQQLYHYTLLNIYLLLSPGQFDSSSIIIGLEHTYHQNISFLSPITLPTHVSGQLTMMLSYIYLSIYTHTYPPLYTHTEKQTRIIYKY